MTDEEQAVKVWAATTIPGPHPLSGKDEGGYGVAWVDTDAGTRIQVLVEALPVPTPDSVGRLSRRTIEGEDLLLYVPHGSDL